MQHCWPKIIFLSQNQVGRTPWNDFCQHQTQLALPGDQSPRWSFLSTTGQNCHRSPIISESPTQDAAGRGGAQPQACARPSGLCSQMPGAAQQGHLVAQSLPATASVGFFPWSSPGPPHRCGLRRTVSPLSENTRLNTTLWLLKSRAPGVGFASPPGLCILF